MNKKIRRAENAQIAMSSDSSKSKNPKLMEKRKSKIASSAVKNVAKKPKHAKNLKASKSRKIMVSNDQSQEVGKEKCKRVPESCKKNNIKKPRVVSAVVTSKTAPKLPVKKAAPSKGKAVAAVKGRAKTVIVKV